MKTIEVKYVGGKPEVVWQGIVFKRNEPKKIKMQDDWVLPFNIVKVNKEAKKDGDNSTARIPFGKKRVNKLQ